MKEFFTTSSIPYWMLFIISVTANVVCYRLASQAEEKGKPSRKAMLWVSGAMLFVALFVIILYATLGGNALWWIHDKETGYFSRVLLVIPLVVFLAAEVLSPFLYKSFMQSYFGVENLSVKPQFISLVIIIPAALILIYAIGSLFMGPEARDIAFYAVVGAGLIGAIIYSLRKNIVSVGSKVGVMYTVTSFILCAAALLSVLYFFVAMVSLVLELLPVVAIIIGIYIIFGKSFGNAVMRRDNDGNYIANDGSKYSSASARDARDSQIRTQQNNSN